MKTVGRIMIVLLAAVLIGWAMIEAVNANASSNPAGLDQPRGADFQPQGERVREIPEGMRLERDRESGGIWLADTIRNLGVIALLVAVIVLSKMFFKRHTPPAAIRTG